MIAGLQTALALAALCVKTWLLSSPDHYKPLELLLGFCRTQIGRSVEFTKALSAKAQVLEALKNMKAPVIDPEPAEDLRWTPSMLWLSRLKVSLGVQELQQQLSTCSLSSARPPLFQASRHIHALVSQSFWVSASQFRLHSRLKPVFEGLSRI